MYALLVHIEMRFVSACVKVYAACVKLLVYSCIAVYRECI
jgi:hypothetical protein